jgi:predicted DNA-binding transcriptional regulator YafY
MPSEITKLQRWIDLIAFLAGHRFPVSLTQISRHVPAYQDLHPEDGAGPNPSVQRMFERDKAELKDQGIQIAAAMREGEAFYSLSFEGFSLPFLRLVQKAHPTVRKSGQTLELEMEAEDAAAVISGLRMLAAQPGSPLRIPARSALRKLSFDFPDALASESPDASLDDSVIQLEDPEVEAASAQLTILQNALERRETVHFHYWSMRRGVPTWRFVDPWGLLYEAGKWYLIGRDHDTNVPRMFRVGRMDEVTIHPRGPGADAFKVPADFRIRDWAGRQPWQYGPPEIPMVPVHVLIQFPRSRWAERNGLGTAVFEHPDGDMERRFEVRDPDAFARWVMGMGGDVRVLGPEDVAARVRVLAKDLARRHQGAPTPSAGSAP